MVSQHVYQDHTTRWHEVKGVYDTPSMEAEETYETLYFYCEGTGPVHILAE